MKWLVLFCSCLFGLSLSAQEPVSTSSPIGNRFLTYYDQVKPDSLTGLFAEGAVFLDQTIAEQNNGKPLRYVGKKKIGRLYTAAFQGVDSIQRIILHDFSTDHLQVYHGFITIYYAFGPWKAEYIHVLKMNQGAIVEQIDYVDYIHATLDGQSAGQTITDTARLHQAADAFFRDYANLAVDDLEGHFAPKAEWIEETTHPLEQAPAPLTFKSWAEIKTHYQRLATRAEVLRLTLGRRFISGNQVIQMGHITHGGTPAFFIMVLTYNQDLTIIRHETYINY